jgi:hypothetical protein
MKKFVLFLSLVLLVLALSACGAAKKEVNQPATGSAKETAQPFSGSVMDLLKLGKSTKCVLEAKNGVDITSGTTYISGNKARSDYQASVIEGETMSGYYISDGTWMYTWNDNYKEQAIKFKIDQMPTADTQAQKDSVKTSDLQDKMDYKCYPWSADQSMFTPPADLNFVDYTQMMQNAQNTLQNLNTGAGTTGDSSLCAACNNITDASAKTTCKQKLGCK